MATVVALGELVTLSMSKQAQFGQTVNCVFSPSLGNSFVAECCVACRRSSKLGSRLDCTFQSARPSKSEDSLSDRARRVTCTTCTLPQRGGSQANLPPTTPLSPKLLGQRQRALGLRYSGILHFLFRACLCIRKRSSFCPSEEFREKCLLPAHSTRRRLRHEETG